MFCTNGYNVLSCLLAACSLVHLLFLVNLRTCLLASSESTREKFTELGSVLHIAGTHRLAEDDDFVLTRAKQATNQSKFQGKGHNAPISAHC